MCIHHLVLGDLLNYFIIDIRFLEDNINFDILLYATKKDSPKLSVDRLNELYDTYMKYEKFANLNSIKLMDKRTKTDFTYTQFGLCIILTDILVARYRSIKKIHKIVESPFIMDEPYKPKTQYNIIKCHESIKSIIDNNLISGPKNFYIVVINP